MFTSGLYLRLSGAALHTTLVALQHQQTPVHVDPFSRQGLSAQTFDKAEPELQHLRLPWDIAPAVEHLRAIRSTQRASSNIA